MDFDIQWHEGDGCGHGDIRFHFNGACYPEDSYYFGIAAEGQDDAIDAEHVFAAMILRIECALPLLQEGESLFAPIGLSDQCSRWLQIQRRGSGFRLGQGDSLTEGWSISVLEMPTTRRPPRIECTIHWREWALDELVAKLRRIRMIAGGRESD